MEWNISDLLDGLQEVPVDILPYTTASESRIRELTMAKIQKQGISRKHRSGVGVISKALIAAVLVTTLVISVMAATVTQFEDWIVGLEEPKTGQYSQYDSELLLGSESYYWEVSGWWIHIRSVDPSATGTTIDCMEYGDYEKTGSLTMDGAWWLEQWTGSGYEPIDVTIPAGELFQIEPQSKYRWQVDWSDTHGAIPSGSYRLGIPFTYTAEDGTAEELKFYAKFRIFSEEMAGYIQKCNDALEARYKQEILHYQETRYPTHSDLEYDYYTNETWKYGNDYLEVTSYFYEDGRLYDRRGKLLRDGRGYTLHWMDEACEITAQWHRAKYVEDSDVTYGFYLRGEMYTPVLGEIWDDGNTIYAVSYTDFIDESLLTEEDLRSIEENDPYWNYNYDEQVYTFDDSGNLTGYEHIRQTARSAEESERTTAYKFEVFDTDPKEIRKMIDKQNVSTPGPFDWTEDQELYGEIAVTEGFQNTTVRKITCADEAIDRAWNEADITKHPDYREGDEYNMAQVCYDETADVWKVGLYFSQDYFKKIFVYLSGDGITLMTVYPPDP